jgi:hypothetical protein
MKNHLPEFADVSELSSNHSSHMPVWSDSLVIFMRPQVKYKFQVATLLHFIGKLPQQKFHFV